jgi:hypothetical protein
LALLLKPLIQARAKENQLQGKDNLKQFSESPVHQNSDKPANPKIDTYKEVAKMAGGFHGRYVNLKINTVYREIKSNWFMLCFKVR